jgi:hypothetical protein
MPSPAELRETSRAFEVAEQESDPHLRHRIANHAFALAQLAENIEREEGFCRSNSRPLLPHPT